MQLNTPSRPQESDNTTLILILIFLSQFILKRDICLIDQIDRRGPRQKTVLVRPLEILHCIEHDHNKKYDIPWLYLWLSNIITIFEISGGEKEKKADVGENVLVRSCQMFMTMIWNINYH